MPREAVVLPWEPVVPRGGESPLGHARAHFVAAANVTAVIAESVLIFFVVNPLKRVSIRSCKQRSFCA